ncbi:P-II family nitrogen regulator [Sulfitobacter sabulilitoris]|uniref:Nitrogen regulatory protein P-II n=1 Tax=Sulfitobacter sabulilitoris TaxID=2562655 RepID=A0A5S3PEF5_9RHOB|nr:transcriptional regulator [Sulfitobacter sabulilitoris]TMM52424.1 transcriptional regulator [Sulfitobacter sabulilitoris]
MQTHSAKRVEITIEAVMQSRLTDALKQAGVSGYTVLPVLGGSGRSGDWTRAGEIGRASGMVQVVCILRPERLSVVLERAFAVVEKHIGLVTVSDCDVIRAERF